MSTYVDEILCLRWSPCPTPCPHPNSQIFSFTLNTNVLTKKHKYMWTYLRMIWCLRKDSEPSVHQLGRSELQSNGAECDANKNMKKKWQSLIVARHFYAKMKHLALLWLGCIFSILFFFCTFVQPMLLITSEFKTFWGDFYVTVCWVWAVFCIQCWWSPCVW